MGKKNTEICFDQQLVLQLLMPQDGDWHNMTSSYILQSAIFDSRHEFNFFFFFTTTDKKKNTITTILTLSPARLELCRGACRSRGETGVLWMFFFSTASSPKGARAVPPGVACLISECLKH